MENWTAYHSDGWELFAGYQGMRQPPGRGEYVTLVGSESGEWRVGPRGGVRKVKEVAR